MNTPTQSPALIMCDCGHLESEHPEFTSGYGTDKNGKTHCYDCCAEQERAYMRTHGKNTLYLVKRDNENWNRRYHVTDWTGKIDFPVIEYSKSRHNIGRERVDVWFVFEGVIWHGYQIGDWNEVCHCQATKKTAK